ncbi:MAG: hypothetical protein GC206_05090 [Alphaproteobacteria bacterium]|nr:hypothetical protein [Alphaproteobacteria bacterium]
MSREERSYDPPKRKKDRSGFVIRTAALALMSGAVALIVVYMMNAPTGSLTPPSDQAAQLRTAPPQFRSFEEAPALEEAAAPQQTPASFTPEPEPAPRARVVEEAETGAQPFAPTPLPLPEAPSTPSFNSAAEGPSPLTGYDG